jgi:stage V sporulation protein G
MKIVRMNPLKSSSGGKTAAFFDIQTDDGIVIKGFRIVNGAKGFFISSPDEKGKDGKYYETVILPKEIKDPLEKIALEEYKSAQVKR